MLFRTSQVHRVVRRAAAISVVGTGVAGTTALAYAHTDQGLGFKRQVEFWWSIGPIVFDYWWNSYPNSPKVKLQAAAHTTFNTSTDNIEEADARNVIRRKELITSLHERNAPKIFNTMINLGGLYIKLGQVLSVTVLPIPDQYRILFRTLQSNVPGASDFESVVKPTLEKELGAPLDTIFDSIDKIPCGAASIGQAHRATLRDTKEEVIIKVQYPNARWQIPADIECLGDFLHLCVQFGIVDESSSTLSYEEFARQFLAELDYESEKENLKLVHQSSLDPASPYMSRGVLIPRVFEEYCTKQVITMTYLPGPKFEEFAKKQLALLGIDPERGVKSVVMEGRSHGIDATTNNTEERQSGVVGTELALSPESSSFHWKMHLSRFIGNFVSVDSMFCIVRFARRILLWSTAVTVRSIQAASTLSVVPNDWKEWANEQEHAILQSERWDWIQEAVSTLIDVHGYQILNQGLFNADCHPGNILIVQDEKNASMKPKLGLIDYGQVKRLNSEERVKVAKLILSIANKESDEVIADNFRSMGIKTKSNSTRFLAEFGKLMFDSLEAKHLDRNWHRELHKEDRVLYFPTELSMVYRTTLLLRGLAMSLQFNPSVGEAWRHHAEETIKMQGGIRNQSE